MSAVTGSQRKIHAIQTGRVKIKRAQVAGRGHGLGRRLAPMISAEWTEWLPTFAFAIEHREGVIVVDTGANAGLRSLPRWHPYFQLAVRFDIEREQEIGPALAGLGINPRDVKTVVLTHLHIDHDGGLKDFPFSRVLVSAGELQAASGAAGRLRGYLPQRWPSGFDPLPILFSDAPFGPVRFVAPVDRGPAQSSPSRPLATRQITFPSPCRTANRPW